MSRSVTRRPPIYIFANMLDISAVRPLPLVRPLDEDALCHECDVCDAALPLANAVPVACIAPRIVIISEGE